MILRSYRTGKRWTYYCGRPFYMSTRHRPAELRIPYFRHRHRHCLKPKCRQDFGRFQAMRNLSHMLLFLSMNHLHGYKWTLGIHKSKRIQAKESSPSWSLFPVPPHANLCYSIPKTDRQTDRRIMPEYIMLGRISAEVGKTRNWQYFRQCRNSMAVNWYQIQFRLHIAVYETELMKPTYYWLSISFILNNHMKLLSLPR